MQSLFFCCPCLAWSNLSFFGNSLQWLVLGGFLSVHFCKASIGSGNFQFCQMSSVLTRSPPNPSKLIQSKSYISVDVLKLIHCIQSVNMRDKILIIFIDFLRISPIDDGWHLHYSLNMNVHHLAWSSIFPYLHINSFKYETLSSALNSVSKIVFSLGVFLRNFQLWQFGFWCCIFFFLFRLFLYILFLKFTSHLQVFLGFF